MQPDGTLRVTETSTINFTKGTFQRGFRLFDADPDLRITDVSARDNAGQVLTVERDGSESEGLRLTYFFAQPVQNERRTFTLNYTVAGALQSATDRFTLLNWVAVFSDRAGLGVRNARVSVKLPIDSQIREATAYGVDTERLGGDESTVTFDVSEEIPSGTSLTVDIVFSNDSVRAAIVTPTPEPAQEIDPLISAIYATAESNASATRAARQPIAFSTAVSNFRDTRTSESTASAGLSWVLLFGALFGLLMLLQAAGILPKRNDDDDDDDSSTSGSRHRSSRSSSSSSSSRSSGSSSGGSSGASGSKGSGGGGFG